jgi:hypothetical protein
MHLVTIQDKIYEVNGIKVMLDFDLAELYEVETRVLNQAIKRNVDSFPEDFMFRLTKEEWVYISSQFVTTSSSSQIVMMDVIAKNRNDKYAPYAFTEQGVAMLSGILRSSVAITMNISIMRAFVDIRRIVLSQNDLKDQLDEIKGQLGEHDYQLNQIYAALENLMDEKAARRQMEERKRIGF